jgi:hypothetical protein
MIIMTFAVKALFNLLSYGSVVFAVRFKLKHFIY